MKSPFPGMDPYLELRWGDVHSSLVTLITEAIQPLLPSDLRARGEERILLEDTQEKWKAHSAAIYRPDVAIIDLGRASSPNPAPSSGATATAEPIRIHYQRDPEIDRFVHIIDIRNDNRIVTSVEILSASNKRPGPMNKDYREKLTDYERAQINIVEIDLLRTPSRDHLAVTDADIPPQRRGAYLVCVYDVRQPDDWLAYPISLRTAIPAIPIPLRAKDAPVTLSLQPLIERAYTIGGHDDIDYRKDPVPPLSPEDAAWADGLLREARRRP